MFILHMWIHYLFPLPQPGHPQTPCYMDIVALWELDVKMDDQLLEETFVFQHVI